MENSAPGASHLAMDAAAGRRGYRGWRRDLLCLALALLSLAVFAYGKTSLIPGLDGPMTFDGHYYSQIGEHGYSFDGRFEKQQNTAYLPLMAMVIQGARMVIPGLPPLSEIALLGLVILFLTLVGIHRLTATQAGPGAAAVAVTLWALSPLSFYNFVGYADPLYAMLVVWTLFFVVSRAFWAACLLAGLALLARPQAFVLAVFVAVAVLWTVRTDWRRVLSTTVPLQLSLIAIPLLAFATYCAFAFGDSAVYVNSLEGWRNGSFLDGNLPFWKALPYFVDAASTGRLGLSTWISMLVGTALAMTFGIFLFTLHTSRLVAAFYACSVLFVLFTASFDVINVARHLFFIVPWVVLAAIAHVRSLPLWWTRLPVLLAWLAFSLVVNLEAISRYYGGKWVS